MSKSATPDARTADSSVVHRRLGKLFGCLWLATAFYLIVFMGREVWEWSWKFIVACAAPPLISAIALATGDFKGAAINGVLLVPVVVSWWSAAASPSSRARYAFAAAVIVAYWVFLALALAFSA